MTDEEKEQIISILEACAKGKFDPTQSKAALSDIHLEIYLFARNLQKLPGAIEKIGVQLNLILEGKEITTKIEMAEYALMRDICALKSRLDDLGINFDEKNMNLCLKIVNYVEREGPTSRHGLFNQTVKPFTYEEMSFKLTRFVQPLSISEKKLSPDEHQNNPSKKLFGS